MCNIDCMPLYGRRYGSDNGAIIDWQNGGQFVSFSGNKFSIKDKKQLISEGFLGIRIEYVDLQGQLKECWTKL